MIYVPKIYNLDAEYKALDSQNFSINVMPLLLLVMEKKSSASTKSILDDFESLIKKKTNNTFFVSIPQNLPLARRKLKTTVSSFYKLQKSDSKAYENLMKRFSVYSNVIPTLEVKDDLYTFGMFTTLRSSIPSSSNVYAYYISASSFGIFQKEIDSIITSADYLIYDLGIKDFSDSKIQSELLAIQKMKTKKKFKTIAIKQIYCNLTSPNYPDGKILPTTAAYKCIDFKFYSDFKKYNFDSFGDCCGIRDIPIFTGGLSYPSYLTTTLDNFDHYGFKGTPIKTASFESVLLPKYIASDHWNNILTPTHKANCHGCKMIENFNAKLDNPNSAPKWKTVTVSHFIESMDYKIMNGII